MRSGDDLGRSETDTPNEPGAARPKRPFGELVFVNVEIVEDGAAARAQGRGELRLDLDREGIAVRRSFDDP